MASDIPANSCRWTFHDGVWTSESNCDPGSECVDKSGIANVRFKARVNGKDVYEAEDWPFREAIRSMGLALADDDTTIIVPCQMSLAGSTGPDPVMHDAPA